MYQREAIWYIKTYTGAILMTALTEGFHTAICMCGGKRFEKEFSSFGPNESQTTWKNLALSS